MNTWQLLFPMGAFMNTFKKFIYILLVCSLIFSLTGCSSSKTYEQYVRGLLDLNYKGEFDDYTKTTKSRESDAEAIYEASMDSLADSYIEYYGIKLVDSGETKVNFIDLVKKIYSKSNYEVVCIGKIADVYYVDVTVAPMDILDITNEEVINYIEEFNDRIAKGDFDEYEIIQYEQEYADGIIAILENAIPNISYKEATTLSIPISEGDYYSINDYDFIAISKLIITKDASEDGLSLDDAENSESITE